MVLRLGSQGYEVKVLQEDLIRLGYTLRADEDFGGKTETAVKAFQKTVGLKDDGVVGNDTRTAITNALSKRPSITLQIHDYFLQPDEYYNEIVSKDTAYIHHTAGGGNAKNVIGGWEVDKNSKGQVLKIATPYVIGGFVKEDAAMDGAIYRAFDDRKWAHHLGTKLGNNVYLNKKCIGIEVCCWGQLTLTREGKFLNYVHKEVPAEFVTKLDKPFRGFTYYHKYSDKQLESLRKLLIMIRDNHGINIKKNWTAASFEFDKNAAQGVAGIYSHTNVRSDKNDMYPCPRLISVLNSF